MPPATRVPGNVNVRGSAKIGGNLDVDGFVEIDGVRLTADDLRALLALIR